MQHIASGSRSSCDASVRCATAACNGAWSSLSLPRLYWQAFGGPGGTDTVTVTNSESPGLMNCGYVSFKISSIPFGCEISSTESPVSHQLLPLLHHQENRHFLQQTPGWAWPVKPNGLRLYKATRTVTWTPSSPPPPMGSPPDSDGTELRAARPWRALPAPPPCAKVRAASAASRRTTAGPAASRAQG